MAVAGIDHPSTATRRPMAHKRPRPVTSVPDRRSYLWLAVALVFLVFGTARWAIPLAAWLYPLFMLRFVRSQPPVRGTLLTLLGTVLVLEVTWIGFLPMPPLILAALVLAYVIPYVLPFPIDRVLAPRLGGMLGTLVFPSTVTAVWYLWSLSPWGTIYNPVYTQYGNLPLLQLASVTGVWGILFLVYWFASVVNWAWEHGFAWPQMRGGFALYSGLLVLVLLFGGARLALFPPQADTVRVAGISPSRTATAEADQQTSHMSKIGGQNLLIGKAPEADRQIYGQANARVFDDSLRLSEQEARAGAKIIVWPEANAGGYAVLEEDLPGLLAKASALAQTYGIYLDLGVAVVLQHPIGSHGWLDESILIDPTGAIVWRQEKAHPVFIVESFIVPGADRVPTVQTPYGRLASVVCYDDVFPGTLRQGGQAGADVMLVPANDWEGFDTYHTQLAAFRAIENGYSLVRPDAHALSMVVDYQGHVLGASDYYTTDPQVVVAYVPTHGVRTVYALIGDLFAWLSVAGMMVLIGVAIARRRKAAGASEVQPNGVSALTTLAKSQPDHAFAESGGRGRTQKDTRE